MTFLEIVNEVLDRLREAQVQSVNASPYSRLIGRFVNDAKRTIEDAWTWDSQYTTIPVTTVAGTNEYTVTGSGLRFKDVDINDSTSGRQFKLQSVPFTWIQNQLQLTTTNPNQPGYYAWNGNNGTDSILALYPVPNGAYNLNVNLCVPQVKLVNDTDVLVIEPELVILGAYARALVERGEDGGLASSEAYGLFKTALSDAISIEMSRDNSMTMWEAV